ncbi:RidA family protein [Bradyrhizobium sp. HKCCYLS20291]|uniref:RidA family protein n=1 Tax=Bradyrhizobium sp. HKCCYLS20291 TaxID=3420766 RepID=UPI003EB7F31F
MPINVVKPRNPSLPIAPYAQAIEVSAINKMLFVSGTMGLQPDGTLSDDFDTQCHQVWRNIQDTLVSAGMDWDNLVRVTVWLADGKNWKRAAAIRQQYLGDRRLAMSVIQVGLVDHAWLLEVEGIAVA